jgi:hypothetical protein
MQSNLFVARHVKIDCYIESFFLARVSSMKEKERERGVDGGAISKVDMEEVGTRMWKGVEKVVV